MAFETQKQTEEVFEGRKLKPLAFSHTKENKINEAIMNQRMNRAPNELTRVLVQKTLSQNKKSLEN